MGLGSSERFEVRVAKRGMAAAEPVNDAAVKHLGRHAYRRVSIFAKLAVPQWIGMVDMHMGAWYIRASRADDALL